MFENNSLSSDAQSYLDECETAHDSITSDYSENERRDSRPPSMSSIENSKKPAAGTIWNKSPIETRTSMQMSLESSFPVKCFFYFHHMSVVCTQKSPAACVISGGATLNTGRVDLS